jgi:hypothetical protein
MALSDGIGTKVYIGGVVDGDAAASSLASGQSWAEVGEVESIGELGISAADIPFTSLSAGKVRHRKGAIDYGGVQIVCAKVPDDVGQLAMTAAAASRFAYAVRVVEADGEDASATDTVHYLVALISQDRVANGSSSAVNKRTFNLLVNDWDEVPSA